MAWGVGLQPPSPLIPCPGKGSCTTSLKKCPSHTGRWRANQGEMVNMGRGVHTVFSPILSNQQLHLPFLFSLGGAGGAGAEDLHQPRSHTASTSFSGTRVGGSSSVMGLGGPWTGGDWGCMAASQAEPRKKLIPPTSEPWAGAEGIYPLSPQPSLTSDSPRRGGQSNWGWDGEIGASVTVRPHCRGAFPFPLGGLRFCVFFLRGTARA